MNRGDVYRTMLWRSIAAAVLLLSVAQPATAQTGADLTEQVRSAEAAFAQTMADRNFEAFITFVADEAVFFGTRSVLRGVDAVGEGWTRFFEGETPPFSWAPDQVEVLDSGNLALSSGPVFDADGNHAGTFNSIWRLENDGAWRVVFDKGCPPCDCGDDAGN